MKQSSVVPVSNRQLESSPKSLSLVSSQCSDRNQVVFEDPSKEQTKVFYCSSYRLYTIKPHV